MGPYVHDLDPVFAVLAGVPLYWYGLAYSIGFIAVYGWLKRRAAGLEYAAGEAELFAVFFASGALLGGRIFEIIVYEWSYYEHHVAELPAFWRGGMATHGVILGSILGALLFCRLRRKSFLALADTLVIPAAFGMAVGRVGNFINGEIYGQVTDVWWAVKFPYAEGFRHPVALYDALKNLAIIPILLQVSRRRPAGSGLALAHFVFWYGFLRIFVDLFREYGVSFLGAPTGQYFNVMMTMMGLSGAYLAHRCVLGLKCGTGASPVREPIPAQPGACLRRGFGRQAAVLHVALSRPLFAAFFIALLLFSLTIPSGWSRGWLENVRAEKTKGEITHAGRG